jgi:hypothetical protein
MLGVSINILSKDDDVRFCKDNSSRPVVINTCNTYTVPRTLSLFSGTDITAGSPYLHASLTLFQELFDNHLLELISSPWANVCSVRKIITIHVGYNFVQAQAWEATDGMRKSKPGLMWRKKNMSKELRTILGKLAVLGSGVMDMAIRHVDESCPPPVFGMH